MKSKMKYFVIAILVVGFASMAAGFAGAAEQKGMCANPIKETIDKTASIKEMQSKPASAPSCTVDALGNKIPAQTDNSGDINR